MYNFGETISVIPIQNNQSVHGFTLTFSIE